MSRTRDFDDAIGTLTQDRGLVYSHPLDNFARINHLKKGVKDCPHDGVRHALEMIAIKMARLTVTPTHADSAHDIAGYARTICMILDEEERRNVR
jgi:hypothetical protein